MFSIGLILIILGVIILWVTMANTRSITPDWIIYLGGVSLSAGACFILISLVTYAWRVLP